MKLIILGKVFLGFLQMKRTITYCLLRDLISKAFIEILNLGLHDRGRFEYYKDGMEKFFNHPLFGAGFGNSHGTNDRFIISAPEYFHNTIIQILASCGVIGFGAYVYHRWQTVKLFWNTRNPYSFFTAMSILALLLTSLLDIHLFNIFPTIIYSTMLCIFERYTMFRKEKKKAALLNSDTVH
jgi:O-antigen ligase